MICSSLKIAALPLPISTARKVDNLAAAEAAVARLAGLVDVAVLPELFTTGFVADAALCRRLAEPMTGPAQEAVRRMAAHCHCAVAGSMLALDDAGRVCNRAFFVEPDGETTTYDKRHLFTLSPERNMLEAGRKEPPVVRFRGWNVALIVCFDLRFPVWCRNRFSQRPYDVMLVPANWPDARAAQWHALLAARAIENQAYYVGADCSGNDEFGSYPESMTCAYDALGRSVATATDGVMHLTLSRQDLERVRTKLPFAEAADSFTLKL